MGIKQAKVITITSVKGGTGKSVLVNMMANVLSENKIKTIILDLDLFSGVVAPLLNLKYEKDIFNLVSDYINNSQEGLEEYVTKYTDYVEVLPAPKDPRDAFKINPSYIDLIIKKLKYMYDVILIDTNHLMDGTNLITFDNSDKIIYLMTNDLMDIRNMKTMLTIYKDMNVDKYITILNEAISKGVTSKNNLEMVLGEEIKYILPNSFYNKNIQKQIMNGKINIKDKDLLNKILNDALN